MINFNTDTQQYSKCFIIHRQFQLNCGRSLMTCLYDDTFLHTYFMTVYQYIKQHTQATAKLSNCVVHTKWCFKLWLLYASHISCEYAMHKDLTPAEISEFLPEITGYKSEIKHCNLIIPQNYRKRGN